MAQTINVDVTPSLFQPTLYYHQGDIGRELSIIISSKDGYSIPSGAVAKIQATKPSGFGFSIEGTISGNTASFSVTETMSDECGKFPAQIEVSNNGVVLFTANFRIVVQRNVHPDWTIDGDMEHPEIENLNQAITIAVDNWLDDHPEATTTVQDGVITNAKLDDELMGNILATNMNSIALSAEKIINFSELGVSGFGFQSCTYDSFRDHFILVFSDNTNAKIVTVSDDWEIIDTYDVLNAYHANDITYNLKQDKLYLATMTNNILVLDPADMSVVSTIDFGEQVSQIAYDDEENIFYVGRTSTDCIFYKCNAAMEKIETYSEFTLESVRKLLTIDSSQTFVPQSVCVVDGCLYLVAYTWDSSYEINSNAYIILIAPDDNYAFAFSTTYAGEEPESLLLKGNIGHLISWRIISQSERQIIIYKASLSKSLVFENNSYYRGKAIHDIDLNDLIETGNYFSKNASVTATITNSPVTSSFTLLVRSQGYENTRQILFGDSTNDIYTRVIYPSTGYIESWYKIQMNSVNASWNSIKLSSDQNVVFYYRRISTNQVEWKLDTGGSTHPTQTTVGTLPNAFIPKSGWYFALARWMNNGTQGVNALRITTNGEIQIITTDDYVHGSGIFSIS